MPDTKESATPERTLDECWHDQCEQDFNVEIHRLLDKAATAMDTSNEPGPKGPLAAINRTLAAVDRIRGRLIAEQEFRARAANVKDIRGAADKRAAGATMKAIAARIHAALSARDRTESTIVTAALAVDQLSSDDTRHIAHVLESKGRDDIYEVYQHLHAAMQLIPESDRPDTFALDKCHGAPDLEDAS